MTNVEDGTITVIRLIATWEVMIRIIPSSCQKSVLKPTIWK
jgi:hypothetical protein